MIKRCWDLGYHLVKEIIVEVPLVEHGKVLQISLPEVNIDHTVKREVQHPAKLSQVFDLLIPRLGNLHITQAINITLIHD